MAMLKSNEPGTLSARHVLERQLEDAAAELSRARLTDRNVHEARKSLKKARATLRLLRTAIGKDIYARTNTALRDAARPLSGVRDAGVLPDALDKLLSRYGAAGEGLTLERLRRQLRAEHLRARRRITKAQLAAISKTLSEVLQRSKRWHPGRRGWSVLGRALSRTYGKGRKAMTIAQSRSTEDLHEWRKQVKYLRYQLRVLEPLWSGVIGELTDQAHTLTDYLGDDHDLAMLRERIDRSDDATLGEQDRAALLALIDRCRAQLQNKAFILGHRLYEERPSELYERFGDYWRTWRREREAASA
jgi:CHAD domain-containing protein